MVAQPLPIVQPLRQFLRAGSHDNSLHVRKSKKMAVEAAFPPSVPPRESLIYIGDHVVIEAFNIKVQLQISKLLKY